MKNQPNMAKSAVELEDLQKNYDAEPYFALLDMYFDRNKQVLVQHHIDSFNQFIDEIIPSIIQGGENVIHERASEDKIVRHRLTFSNLGIKPPTIENDEGRLYPIDAIQKNLTYSSKYTATVTQWQDIIDINTGETDTQMIGAPDPDVPIAKIPIMVGSKYCNLVMKPDPKGKHCKYDMGGYFIVNGGEKVILSAENMIQRKPMVFSKKDQNSLIYYVQVHSRPDTQFVGNIQMFTIKLKKDNTIVFNIPYFKEISIFTLMRALGLEADEDITDAILDSKRETNILNILSVSLNSQSAVTISREEAIELLVNSLRSTKSSTETDPEIKAQQKRKYVMKILTQSILPHVTSGTNNPEIDMLYKGLFIGQMIRKLLKCSLRNPKELEEMRGCDDRDSMLNKRIELPGILLGGLFEQFFKKMLSDCNKTFRNRNTNAAKTPNIIGQIKANPIEQGLRQALSTGTFGSQSRKGLAQMLNRLNHMNSLSYMRRVIYPITDASTNKMVAPRQLHNSQWAKMCPLETPEGAKTGFTKNMAMLTNITVAMHSQIPKIKKYLLGKIKPLETVNRKQLHTNVKVFINRCWIGMVKDFTKVQADLRRMRFHGELEKSVSFYFDYDQREFHIYTEGGRLIRPYLVVTDNELNFKPHMLEGVTGWDEFMLKYPEVIEYVDSEEEQNMMLAVFPAYVEKAKYIMKTKSVSNVDKLDRINRTNRYDGYVYERYTHCEIHPSMLLGVVSSSIPFPEHNQGTRGIFQYNQAKQAMGLYISDYRERTDISYILYHSQIPIVASRAAKYTGSHIFPAGENAIVAIASYMGYNQEDSMLMNLSATQKGFMRAQSLKKAIETIKKNPASSQPGIFMKPDRDKVDGIKDANYSKLTEDGYCRPETSIKNGDVIIGMVNPKPTTTHENDKPYKDNSTIYKSLKPGAIDKVILGINQDGYPLIKIRIRSERIPDIGDKFTSRAGQKGTIGFKPHRADLMYSEDGLVPDIIINPNCMPKRMTIGQMIEGLLGKLCAIKGVYGDATPYTGLDFDAINKALVEAGGEPWGNQTMYSGLTGKKLETKIFITPTYYQRLKQMVADKVHSRSRGPTQFLTRQPPDGRIRDGGSRVGEMERDAMCAHGIAQFLKERMVDNSDIYTTHVCDICGLLAHKVPQRKHYICRTCQNTTRISKIVIPYCFKLFLQELRSINILGRIRTSKSIVTPKS